MKTCNLTQSSLRNDPINRRMYDFSFRIFKDKIEVQDVISPLSRSNLDFKHLLDAKTSQEHEEIKLVIELVSRQFEFLKSSRAKISITNYKLFKGEFGRDR